MTGGENSSRKRPAFVTAVHGRQRVVRAGRRSAKEAVGGRRQFRTQVFGIGIRFVWYTRLAQEEKVVEGALVHHVKAGFVTMHDAEGRRGGEGGKCVDHAIDAVADGFGVHGVVEEAGFESPGAAKPPKSGSHFLDQRHFDLVGGLQALDVVSERDLERFARFTLEDDAAGEQAVTERVPGGDLFAQRSRRSAGKCSVRPRRKNSSL